MFQAAAHDWLKTLEVQFMIARISTWEGSAQQLEGWKTGVLERVKPMVETLEGNVGALFLLDPNQGRAFTITIWKDEEAAMKSEQAARGSQALTTAGSGATMTWSSQHCEVVAKI